MAVFTVYNCGTGSHRDSPDVIAYMNKVTVTPHHINDGAGSGDALTRVSKGGRSNPGGATKFTGIAFGSGVEANVADGIAAIKAQIRHDAATSRGHRPPPPVINMAGWSRGAVTCYKIANAMSRDAELKSIPVDIFAIDPVPGSSGVGNKDMWQDLELTNNVKNCTVIIAWHDSRRAFAPIITPRNKVPVGCKYTVYIMPGNHRSIVEEKAGVVEAAQIVKDMAMKFLRSFNTSFSDSFRLSAGEIIEKYALIAKNFGSYQELAGSYFTSRIIVTQDSKGKSIDSMKLTPERKEGQFFINDHHKELYLGLYPKLYFELTVPAHLAFGKARYKGGWGKEMDGMIATGFTESAAAILRYGQSIGADCTPPRPGQ